MLIMDFCGSGDPSWSVLDPEPPHYLLGVRKKTGVISALVGNNVCNTRERVAERPRQKQ